MKLSLLSLRCRPFLACMRHGRCWTHSDWACDLCAKGYSTTEHPIFGTPGWHSVPFDEGDYVYCEQARIHLELQRGATDVE